MLFIKFPRPALQLLSYMGFKRRNGNKSGLKESHQAFIRGSSLKCYWTVEK